MKIAIITSSAGNGHNSAAHNLAKFAPPGVTIKIFKLENYLSRISRYLFITNYFWLGTFAGGRLWGLFYYLSNTSFGNWFHLFLHKKCILQSRQSVSAALRDFAPDQIISTIFLGPYFLEKDLAQLPHHSVITDFDLHRFWYHPTISTFFVGNQTVAKLLKKINPATKVIVSGIPVDPVFYDQKPNFKKTNKPKLLLLAGGSGLVNLEKYFKVLLPKLSEWDTTIICGKNLKLATRLEQLARAQPFAVEILAWTDQLSEYLKSADIVITKPGGLTVSECLASGKPMILIDPIPGQEKANADFLISENRAQLILSAPDLVPAISHTLNHLDKKNRTIFPVRPAVYTIWESIFSN